MNERLVNTLWTEKYRPKTIDECILPKELNSLFTGMVRADDLQNMIFSGTAGIGKTTVAKALAREMGCDVLVINGSDENGIDVLRTKIKDFATTVSLTTEKHKVVILDEADYLSAAAQSGLRNFMEEFSKNCRFIMTCNFAKRIIEPLHSRSAVVEFKINKKEKDRIVAKFYKRAMYILKKENVEYDGEVLGRLVIRNFPDFRKTINIIQRYTTSYGKIDEGCLVAVRNISVKQVMIAMKKKSFPDIRKWINEYIDQDVNIVYRELFDSLIDFLTPQTVPAAILIIHDHMYKGAFVPDQEINMCSCFIEIMINCEFK